MLRRAFLALAALLALAAPALAETDDPAAIVRELYRVHAESDKGKAPVWRPPHRDRFFARSLAQLLAADEKRKQARLDYDPIYNAQDAFTGTIEATLKSRASTKAVVEVQLKDKETRRLEYDLVRERGAWRVADIRSAGMKPEGRLTRVLRGR